MNDILYKHKNDLSLEELRAYLGEEVSHMSDDQVKHFYQGIKQVAHILVGNYIKSVNK